MRAKHLVTLGIIAIVIAYVATHRDASDWRYPKLIVTQLPKMPFRYFV